MTQTIYPQPDAQIAERRKQLAPGIHDAFQEFSRQVFADGAVDEKTKQLIAVAVAHVTQRLRGRLTVVVSEQAHDGGHHDERDGEVDQHHRHQHPPAINGRHDHHRDDHDQHRREEGEQQAAPGIPSGPPSRRG